MSQDPNPDELRMVRQYWINQLRESVNDLLSLLKLRVAEQVEKHIEVGESSSVKRRKKINCDCEGVQARLFNDYFLDQPV